VIIVSHAALQHKAASFLKALQQKSDQAGTWLQRF
jgi:hypothetical protein